MARVTASAERLGPFAASLRRLVRSLRRLALAGAAGTGAIALALARGGFSTEDRITAALLLAAPVLVLLFAQGVAEVGALPGRLRSIPGEGQERLAELGRVAGKRGGTRVRSLPGLLWRLRGTAGSMRDVAGIALPLRVFAPPFLLLAALSALACLALAGAGVVALLVLVAG